MIKEVLALLILFRLDLPISQAPAQYFMRGLVLTTIRSSPATEQDHHNQAEPENPPEGVHTNHVIAIILKHFDSFGQVIKRSVGGGTLVLIGIETVVIAEQCDDENRESSMIPWPRMVCGLKKPNANVRKIVKIKWPTAKD